MVCGAGVSRDSSIPDWNELLVNILNETFFDDGSNVPKSKILAEDLLSLMPQSNLILGKYLSLLLKMILRKWYKSIYTHITIKTEILNHQ